MGCTLQGAAAVSGSLNKQQDALEVAVPGCQWPWPPERPQTTNTKNSAPEVWPCAEATQYDMRVHGRLKSTPALRGPVPKAVVGAQLGGILGLGLLCRRGSSSSRTRQHSGVSKVHSASWRHMVPSRAVQGAGLTAGTPRPQEMWLLCSGAAHRHTHPSLPNTLHLPNPTCSKNPKHTHLFRSSSCSSARTAGCSGWRRWCRRA